MAWLQGSEESDGFLSGISKDTAWPCEIDLEERVMMLS